VSLISSFGSRSRRGIGAIVVAVFALAYSRQGAGQTPASPAPPLQTFRPPVIVLAEPASDATVPQDRPIVMFRFAAGDSADPIDARSFVVSVDGKDRTPLFEVVADVAFGPLAPPPNNDQVAIDVGSHSFAARICSLRGSCGEVSGTVIVASPGAVASEQAHASAVQTLLDLLLTLIKRLLAP